MSTLSEIYDHTCTRCPLHEVARNVCIEASGDPRYRAMVIGEAPGRNEDSVARPFVGDAGRLLDSALERAFLTERARQEIVVTNVVKCRPPSNRTPTEEEMDACLHYLQMEISQVDPHVILALGNAACWTLLGRTGITSFRGEWHKLDRDNFTWVMPTFHPAYLIYRGQDQDLMDLFQRDVDAFAGKWIAIHGT